MITKCDKRNSNNLLHRQCLFWKSRAPSYSTWKQVPDTYAYKLLSLVTQRIVKEELSNKGHIAGQRSNMMMPYKIYEFCKIFLNSSFSKIQRSSSRKIVLQKNVGIFVVYYLKGTAAWAQWQSVLCTTLREPPRGLSGRACCVPP